MAEDKSRRLWICWEQPGTAPDPADTILTFLRPSAEQRLKREHPGEVIFGREASSAVRKRARTAYLGIVGHLAPLLAPPMAAAGRASRWWYHRVSFKDCEADPTFDRVVALFTILHVANERGIREFVFVGGLQEIRQVLKLTERRNWSFYDSL